MTEGKIEAFLKLFCITELRDGSFEPSWQSWIVLCMCIISALATASSGAYFHHNNKVNSSVICFTFSAAGCVMAMVTFIAILIGCKRRRICSLRNDGELTIYTNPGILEQSTCVQIEHQDPAASHTENQQWMNPAFAEYDKSLYEADWNLEKSTWKTVERDETDFDERDSDLFHSSSDTVTCSHRSYSDDEGYFQNSSKESNVKEFGKFSLERHGNRPEQDILESGQAVENVLVPGTSFDSKGKLPITPQNSKQDRFKLSNQLKENSDLSSNIQSCPLVNSKSTTHFQSKNIPDVNLNLIKNTSEFYSNNGKHELNLDLIEHESVFYRSSAEFRNRSPISAAREKDIKLAVNKNISRAYKEHCNKMCLNKSLVYQNDSVYSRSIKTYNFPKRVDIEESDPTGNVLLHKGSNSSERSARCHIDFESSMPNNLNLLTVVNVKNYYQPTLKREFSLPTKTVTHQNTLASMTQKKHSTVDKRSHSVPPYKNLVAKSYKLELPANFPALPYPILQKESSNPQTKKRRSSKSRNAFIPKYEKRPLLDINGMPLSQKEMVKALTGILTNGLQQLPTHRMEHRGEQTFQLDIESLQPILC